MNQPASVRQSFSDGDLNSFKTWLLSKSYSPSTIRNYLADINRYFNFLKTAPLPRGAVSMNIETEGFSPETVSFYLSSIKDDPNQKRYLSSLSKFFQFAIDQKIISINPLKKARQPKTTIQNIFNDYRSFLIKKHFSSITVKNYLNDLQQFINWQQSRIEPR
jgi:site-specific recombinase XerD